MKVAVVVGVGPGLGSSIAFKFAKAGYHVALMSRSKKSAADAESRIASLKLDGQKTIHVACDATDSESVKTAFETVHKELGPTDVLAYNASNAPEGRRILAAKREDVIKSVTINAIGAMLCAQQVLPTMIERKQGAILFTSATAAFRASAGMGMFAMGKHSLKAVSQAIAREHAQDGVHAVHIRIDCAIDGPKAKEWMGDKYDSDLLGSPDDLADTYVWLAQQPKHGWTNEIDLRPYKEKWTL